MANRPEPEIAVDAALVGGLIEDQFPELAHLGLRDLSRGWDNTNFRLGDELIARIPHRQAAVELIANEQRCLPPIAARVDLPISSPTHSGVATTEFPWPWSITPYFDGSEAAEATLVDPAATAEALGRFLHQVHTPATSDAPPNPHRGGPLAERAQVLHNRVSELSGVDHQAIRDVFDEAAAVTPSTQWLWLHGDLHTRNMIVEGGQLAAIIDWGDVCAGDPATDLAGAFMLVPDEIATVQEHAGATADDWRRARGWAIHFAVMYLGHSDDDPVMGAIGKRLLNSLLAR